MRFPSTFRFVARALLRRRKTTVATSLIFGCGLGVSLTALSLLDHLLLRSLPFANGDRLVAVWKSRLADPEARGAFQPEEVALLRQSASSFNGVEAFVSGPDVGLDLASGSLPQRIPTAAVTSGFFEVLGVRPLSGRVLRTDRAGEREVVIGHRLWKTRFGADLEVVGRAIRLSGREWQVVGVMPPGFDFPGVDLWIGEPAEVAEAMNLPLRVSFSFRVVARLAPGTGLEEAQAELDALRGRLLADGRSEARLRLVAMRDELFGDLRPIAVAYAVASSLLLLVTYANTASLHLLGSFSRQRSLAIRKALGASGRRLAAELVTEGLVTALGGAAVALAVALVLVRAIKSQAALHWRTLVDLTIDGRSGLALLVLAIAWGLLLTAGEARRARRGEPAAVLRGGDGWQPSRRAFRVLLVGEVAFTLVLLVGTGLLARTVVALLRHDIGIDPTHVVTGKIVLPGDRFGSAKSQRMFLDRVLLELAKLPEVAHAATANNLPFEQGSFTVLVVLPGDETKDPRELPMVDCLVASPQYFEALGMKLLRGQPPSSSGGEAASLEMVLDERAAQRLFAGREPLGERVQVLGEWGEVVGVVRNVAKHGFRSEARPTIYVSPGQVSMPWPFQYLIVKTRGASARAVDEVAGAVARVDPEVPFVADMLADRVAQAMAQERDAAQVLAAFSALCLLLAVAGTYAGAAFSLEQRRRELAVRAALGAGGRALTRLVLRESALVSGLGTVAGLAGAVALTRVLQPLLFGIANTDPLSYVLAAAVVVTVNVTAAWVPARRASRLDCVDALRADR